jgi:RNA polymerase sigma-70 factor (ECF subfamily)
MNRAMTAVSTLPWKPPPTVGSTDERRARFEALYVRGWATVHRYARRRADPGDVDDIVAETFLVAWRRLDAIPSDEIPWLLGVARKVLATHRRGAGRHVRLVERLSAEPVLEAAESEPPAYAPEHIQAALARLPEQDREVLLLVYWDDLSPSRAARVVGSSAVATRVRLHRARAKLQRLLASENPEGAEDR